MTTNVYDGNAGQMATDCRWSAQYGEWLFYIDDSGYEKIDLVLENYALMFGGRGPVVQMWKDWIRTKPTGPGGQPAHKGMSVCMVRRNDYKVPTYTAEQAIQKDGAHFAGTGSELAYGCWTLNKDARRAVKTAASADVFTGGDVRFVDCVAGTDNFIMGQSDVTYSQMMSMMMKRGFVMSIATKPTAPFPIKDAIGSAAANDKLREAVGKLANGELQASAPCEGMHNDWTEEEKAKFNKALGEAFGWKKK